MKVGVTQRQQNLHVLLALCMRRLEELDSFHRTFLVQMESSENDAGYNQVRILLERLLTQLPRFGHLTQNEVLLGQGGLHESGLLSIDALAHHPGPAQRRAG